MNAYFCHESTVGRRWIIRFVLSLCFVIWIPTAKFRVAGVVEASITSSNQAKRSLKNKRSKIQRLDLRPTSFLAFESERHGRGLFSDDKDQLFNYSFSNVTQATIPKEWFHPQLRAVYVSNYYYNGDQGQETQEPSEGRRRLVHQEFQRYRHLSRYERSFRHEAGLETYPHWDGNYTSILQLLQESHRWNNETNENLTDEQQNARNRRLGKKPLRSSISGMESTSFEDSRGPHSPITGGQFNHFQGTPLSQGYGTHYVHLWVGSPIPQRQSVIVDTGIHFTAFPCTGCKGCGQEHHTDPYFDPSQSETFRSLQCPLECLEHAMCRFSDETDSSMETQKSQGNKAKSFLSSIFDPQTTSQKVGGFPEDDRCYFTQSYTEGSSWQAYEAMDIVYAGGPDVLEAANPIDRHYALDFMFGCLQRETGLFVTQLADGIMGMSAHEMTLPKQLYNSGKLEYNMFAMCFRRELGTSRRGVTAGSMTLGGVSSTLDVSPMVYAENVQPVGWFTVFVRNMYVAKNGGNRFLMDSEEKLKGIVKIPIDIRRVNSGKGVIVDSGTTDSYLNSDLMPSFVRVWKQVTGMDYTHSPIYLTESQLKRLPTVLIQCQVARGDVLNNISKDPVLGQAGLFC